MCARAYTHIYSHMHTHTLDTKFTYQKWTPSSTFIARQLCVCKLYLENKSKEKEKKHEHKMNLNFLAVEQTMLEN